MTKLSVIIPIYNTAAYLRRCLDSVTNQTIRDIEIILATDGPETCDRICNEYAAKDSRIKIISHPGSYGKAVNQGIEIASGEYIGIVESDDWIVPEMYKKLYSKATISKAEIVKAGYYRSYDHNPCESYITIDVGNSAFHISQHPELLYFQASIWDAIYKKSFLERNNIRLPETRGLSFIDTPFHMETLLKASLCVILNEPLYFYYQDNPSQSIKDNTAICDVIFADHYFIKRIKKNNTLIKNYRKEIIIAIATHFYWNFQRLNVSEKKKKFCIKAARYLKKLKTQMSDCNNASPDLKSWVKWLLSTQNYSSFKPDNYEYHWMKFLYFLPLIKIKNNSASKSFSLAGIIPLLKITQKNKRIKLKLFNFIPLFSIERI